ncbi:MAG TPA: class I SAM-dependent methyltransferase [Usitatibacter sp.]|nr:class I SAM-dependent methyltransferase [Usitatibacter sp.]
MSRASFRSLAREAAARYPARDRYARHFAYGKLTGDPVFEHILASGLIASDARILDLGCGQGLLAALLAAGGRHGESRYRGIDHSHRDIERARGAAGPNAELIAGDIRQVAFGTADVIVLVDVLHYIEPPEQVDLLRRARAALAPQGTLLMRIADASAGLRFRVTEAIDLAATRLRGHSISRLHSRPLGERRAQLEREGLRVDSLPMSAGTPFANVLLVARYDSSSP